MLGRRGSARLTPQTPPPPRATPHTYPTSGDATANPPIGFDQNVHFFPSPELMNFASGDHPEYDCSCAAGPPRYTKITGEEGTTWCSCMSRPQVELDAELVLKAFPFDVQKASITIESSKWQENDLKWVPVQSSDFGLLPPDGPTGVDGWMLSAPSANVTVHKVSKPLRPPTPLRHAPADSATQMHNPNSPVQ